MAKGIMWLWGFALLFTAQAWGQAPNVATGKVLPVAVRATPIFDGYVRDDMESVVYIEALNKGPDMQGSLVYNLEDIDGNNIQWVRRIELPENGKKAWSFRYVPNWGADQHIKLRGLMEPLDIPFQVRSLGVSDVLIGVVGLDAQGINSITRTFAGRVPSVQPSSSIHADDEPRTVRVGLTELYSLPESSEGYRALNWLVWPDADPSSLTPEQLDALLGWVAEGGHLFVSVSDSYRAVMASPLSDLLPGTITELVDTENIGGFNRAVDSSKPGLATVPVATVSLKDIPGRPVWTLATLEDGRPAWVGGTYGLGTVHLVPMSLRNQVIQDEVDLEKMWRRLLWLPPENSDAKWFGYRGALNPDLKNLTRRRLTHAVPPRAMLQAMNLYEPLYFRTDISMDFEAEKSQLQYSLIDYLADIPGVAPLPLSWLLAFALTYLFFIGPFDYFLLKRLKKQPWTWVTFPVYILVFSAIAMVGTSLAKGNQAVVKRLDIVDLLPGTDWVRGSSNVGIFATGRARVTLEPGFPTGVAQPARAGGGFMEQMTRIQSMGADPVQWGTQTWTLAYAHTNWNARMPEERMTVVHQDNGHLRILNETSLDLRECLVVFNGEYWTIGAIPKGASYDEPWASDKGGRHGSFYQHYERSDPENWVREVMPFYSLENRGSWDTRLQPLVVCLSDTSLEPLVVHGLSPKEETLNLIRIPFIVNSNSLEEQ